MLLDVKAMQTEVVRLYNQAKKWKQSVSVVLRRVLAMKVSIMHEGPIGKQITP